MTIKAPYFDVLLAPTVIELARKEKPYRRVWVSYKLTNGLKYTGALVALLFWHYPRAIAKELI